MERTCVSFTVRCKDITQTKLPVFNLTEKCGYADINLKHDRVRDFMSPKSTNSSCRTHAFVGG